MNRQLRLIGIGFVAAIFLAACNNSPPLPKTYPATGTVTKAGRAMKGGSIRFSLASDPTMVVTSEIGDDGGFKLRTVKDSRMADGAPEGEYEVTVQPPVTEQAGGAG